MKKRNLSIALVLIMVVSAFNIASLIAFAETESDLHSHTHCICGDTSCTKTIDGHGQESFGKLTADGGALDGSFYLDEDITLSANITIANGKTVNLDLNGHVLTGNGSGPVISVASGGTLNLCDCGSTVHKFQPDAASGLWVMDNGGTKSVAGGVITGCGGSNSGGGVSNKGTFNMYGGYIVGNKANVGAGVYNENTFNMIGGVICGNEAAQSGGGVYNRGGTFNMIGKAISDNFAKISGGGVYNAGTSTVNMTSGTISDNKAGRDGGGVLNYDTFTMNGGTIERNNAGTADGGGIYNGGTLTMTGGAISNNTAGNRGGGVYFYSSKKFNVSGKVLITGNIVNSAPNNAFLPTNAHITITDVLPDDASIGITTQVAPTAEAPVKAALGGTDHLAIGDDRENFFADNEDYIVQYDDANKQINLAVAAQQGTDTTEDDANDVDDTIDDAIDNAVDEPADTSPETGDTSNMAFWIFLLCISSAALTVATLHGRKKITTR